MIHTGREDMFDLVWTKRSNSLLNLRDSLSPHAAKLQERFQTLIHNFLIKSKDLFLTVHCEAGCELTAG